ncbi:hypothetical protein SI65_06712 [Aspergillus cristatus]|uniref:Uncharacterized protein n=1 Tax=Aspergillus cristatus TaxID=573508 RepID=A0A1E3BAH8_ASPCR|nr:hypothetical protein SI65_06712 [Aspergillus cristatus]
MACVMVLLMDSPALGLTGHVVLKLFDQRFASDARLWEKAGPWTLDIEEQYHQFIRDGGASEFLSQFKSDDNAIVEEEETDEVEREFAVPQKEASLHDYMQSLYRREVEVYNALQDRQGEDIPRI